MKTYRVYLHFHPDLSQPVDEVILCFGCQSHGDAITIALKWKDDILPKAQLKNISVYER